MQQQLHLPEQPIADILPIVALEGQVYARQPSPKLEAQLYMPTLV